MEMEAQEVMSSAKDDLGNELHSEIWFDKEHDIWCIKFRYIKPEDYGKRKRGFVVKMTQEMLDYANIDICEAGEYTKCSIVLAKK